MLIKGFFFDLDGTLVNTYEADFLAYRDAIAEVTGVTIAQSDFAKTHGQEMRQKLTLLAPGLSEGVQAQIAASKKRHYAKYVDQTLPNEALIQFLAIKTEAHILGLVTTAKKHNALLVLEQHGLAEYFDVMVFGDEITHAKPDPECYLLALERAGLKPQETLAFEDSETGIAAAEAAGLSVVRVGTFV
jgi:beta-phosphoglucomutase